MPTTSRQRRKAPLTHDPEALVWARQTAGRTQAWLAEQLGISAGHMSEIESGTRGLTPARLLEASRLLNCPPSVLRSKVSAA
jgi:transcriptional regulator with XRE-family HTH domain